MREGFKITSTTDGRQCLPDHLQDVYGGVQDIVVFRRYRRDIALMTSIDGVKMLAGLEDEVDPAIRERIKASARRLSEHLGL